MRVAYIYGNISSSDVSMFKRFVRSCRNDLRRKLPSDTEAAELLQR